MVTDRWSLTIDQSCHAVSSSSDGSRFHGCCGCPHSGLCSYRTASLVRATPRSATTSNILKWDGVLLYGSFGGREPLTGVLVKTAFTVKRDAIYTSRDRIAKERALVRSHE